MTDEERSEQVVLVNERDEETGRMGKMEAHQQGLLHRAFSVFVFHPDGRLLLQRRADGKYHSAGLWTNTCCSHPRPGEDTALAARRRLWEEMGIDTAVEHRFHFIYRAPFGNGLTEYELDHVFFAVHAGEPSPDPTEASAWRWVRPEVVTDELANDPEAFTVWFRACWNEVLRHRELLRDRA